MRVFISWSGDFSRALADAIHRWLPSALQFVKPYFTPSDVDKGARWASEISKELSTSGFGIIVLTRENLRSPWINFEAGAISRTIDQAKVCPIVFGMEPTDVEWPLAQFQATRFVKEDIHHLFKTINAAADDSRLSESVADGVFAKWWPDLETEVKTILERDAKVRAPVNVRSDRQLVEEMLSLVRSISARQEQIEVSNQTRDLIAALEGNNPYRINPLTGTGSSGIQITPAIGSTGVGYGGGLLSDTSNPIIRAYREAQARYLEKGGAPNATTGSELTGLGPTGAKRNEP